MVRLSVSANDTDGVIEMEANSPLSRLAIGLQERVNRQIVEELRAV